MNFGWDEQPAVDAPLTSAMGTAARSNIVAKRKLLNKYRYDDVTIENTALEVLFSLFF